MEPTDLLLSRLAALIGSLLIAESVLWNPRR